MNQESLLLLLIILREKMSTQQLTLHAACAKNRFQDEPKHKTAFLVGFGLRFMIDDDEKRMIRHTSHALFLL